MPGARTVWIDGRVVTGLASPTAQARLARAWRRRERVGCACQVPAPPMYVAALGARFIVKRMPGTGGQHHRGCTSYQPEVSDFDGVDVRDPERPPPPVSLPSDRKHTVRRTPRAGAGERLNVGCVDLAGLLRFLWHEAGLDAWSPKMEGKRHWGVVSWHLREAALRKGIIGRGFSDLYIPPHFRRDRRRALTEERLAAWETARNDQRVLIVIGEVKTLEAATFGCRLRLKHLSDAPLYFGEDMHARLLQEVPAAVEPIKSSTMGQAVAIAAVSITPRGHARAHEIALMKTTAQWLPYRVERERRVLIAAVERRRRFTCGDSSPCAGERLGPTLILTDTPRPVLVHVRPPESQFPASLCWVWEPGKSWPAVERPAPERLESVHSSSRPGDSRT